jgi:diguanylate cyclase (GGDEF)-like protein
VRDRWLDADLVAPGLDEAARLAQYIAGGGAAAVHLIDEIWQHRVAAVGAPTVRTPVDESMCIQVVRDDAPVYTADATQADRFVGNPFVSGPDPVRLYSSTPLRSDAGDPVGTLCVFDTVSRPLTAEQRDRLDDVAALVSQQLGLARLASRLAGDALTDPLTGVANRLLMSERLGQALERRRRHEGNPALVLLDLDGFKQINDELGHAAGDALLVEVARRLVASVRSEDTVARLGGDEFVITAEQLPGVVETQELHRRLASVFEQPFQLGDHTVTVGGSLGLVVPGEDELSYELLGRADAAMYEAKRARKPGVTPRR